MNDRGDLWAFVSDNPAKDDYFDFAPATRRRSPATS